MHGLPRDRDPDAVTGSPCEEIRSTEDVKISVEGNLLTIKGTKEQVAEEKAEKVHRYERAYGAFERTFTLPATVAPEKIKATYGDGVLTIALPKVEAAKPHLIKVEVAPQKALK